jgi:hypothetical protein
MQSRSLNDFDVELGVFKGLPLNARAKGRYKKHKNVTARRKNNLWIFMGQQY